MFAMQNFANLFLVHLGVCGLECVFDRDVVLSLAEWKFDIIELDSITGIRVHTAEPRMLQKISNAMLEAQTNSRFPLQ